MVLTDLHMADLDGLAIVDARSRAAPARRRGDRHHRPRRREDGRRGDQAGAPPTTCTKPVDLAELRAIVDKAAERLRLARANRELRRQLDEKFGFEGVVGNSPRMHEVLKLLKAVAPTDATVLILGENGTGKELAAKAIHNNSPRKNKPFVAMNCTALNENLLDDELFGHEPGRSPGPTGVRKGRFEYANGGTLFLDEIGDMPLPLAGQAAARAGERRGRAASAATSRSR